MLRTVNALARALGFVWLGLLAFLIAPPSAPYALPIDRATPDLAATASVVRQDIPDRQRLTR